MSEETYSPKVIDREAAHDRLTGAFMKLRGRSGGCPEGPDCADCKALAGDEATTALDTVMELARSEAEVKAEALREAAVKMPGGARFDDSWVCREWLRERADEMEGKS